MTLTEFLLARIAEDEGTAAYAQTRDDVQPEDWGGWWFGHQQHYSRHDPARVLAECEAKRRILELTTDVEARRVPTARNGVYDRVEVRVPLSPGYDSPVDPEEVLRALAMAYADHPGYRQEWRI